MQHRWALVPLFAASVLLAPASAAADEPSAPPPAASSDDARSFAAFITGAATALVPVAIGATIMAHGKTDGEKDVGLVVAGGGIALAPITAHLVTGEWKRAAIFGAIPLAAEAGIAALVGSRPDAVFHGTTLSRTTFGAMMSIDVFIGALGVIDAALASDRAVGKGPFRAGAIPPSALRYVAPGCAGSPLGLTLGGTL